MRQKAVLRDQALTATELLRNNFHRYYNFHSYQNSIPTKYQSVPFAHLPIGPSALLSDQNYRYVAQVFNQPIGQPESLKIDFLELRGLCASYTDLWSWLHGVRTLTTRVIHQIRIYSFPAGRNPP